MLIWGIAFETWSFVEIFACIRASLRINDSTPLNLNIDPLKVFHLTEEHTYIVNLPTFLVLRGEPFQIFRGEPFLMVPTFFILEWSQTSQKWFNPMY